MALPVAVLWGIVEVAAAATTAYELYDLCKSLYEGLGEFEKNRTAAKKYIKEQLEWLEKEIQSNIDENRETVLLANQANHDANLQGEQTRKAEGRKGNGEALIVGAIQQKIPFRKVITLVCDQADKTPAFNLRRKKGVTVKDLPQAKKKILQEILRVGAEEIGQIENIDDFILVRMKQLVASFIFEFIDELLEWRSPLKAEACFGPAPNFADPPLDGATRLKRRGPQINPFYPLPHRQRGSISADLAIPDYRRRPLAKDNLFAIVEIKFQNDRIDAEQFKNYKDLSDKAAKVKTDAVGKHRTLGKKGVTIGCRVSLFRYPEDRAVERKRKQEPEQPKESAKPSRRGPITRKGK